VADPRPGELSLFVHRLRDFVARPAVTCGPDAPAAAVARLLQRERVGSVIVAGGDGSPAGIVTDRDLRAKVLAAGRDPATTPAGAIMSAPLVALPPDAFAFEAVVEMTRRDIRHVAVVDAGRLVGVVSNRDLLTAQAVHPVAIARDVLRAGSVDALRAVGERVVALSRRLLDEGAAPRDVTRVVAELNDRVVRRVLELAAAALAAGGVEAPAVAWCWLGFGSEGRREQTLRTDQDNGLVYADPAPELAGAAAAYCARLGEAASRDLVAAGVPACPGGIMASTPRWCQPLATWTGYFHRWVWEASPEAVLEASIFFDLRPVAGDLELGRALAAAVAREAPARPHFLGLLARDVVDRPVSLTWLGRVRTRRGGPRRGTVDVKGGGGLQLVGAARLHALELGLDETNTVARFEAAGRGGLYPEAEVREITDAHEHLLRLRLRHQLDRLAAGQAADNDLDPGGLSHADALLLRDALHTVRHVQGRLRERFATDFLR
jgi:CBS domain-containing protein